MVREEDSRPRGCEFESRRILDGCKQLPEKRCNFKTIQFYNCLKNFEQVDMIKLQKFSKFVYPINLIKTL